MRAGYYLSEAGVHYLVPPAPLECGEGEKEAFGVLRLLPSAWRLEWRGKEPAQGSGTLRVGPWPKGVDLPYRGAAGGRGSGGAAGGGGASSSSGAAAAP